MKIENKVILITGSAERVGKATALLLARKGARVVIHYHTKEKQGRETAAEIADFSGQPLLVHSDIAREDDWVRIRDEILQHHGRIDVLVNNAAIFYKTPFSGLTSDQWDHFMNVNLKSIYLGCRIIGAEMVRQESGKIINITDVSAERIWKDYLPYCVSKAGVLALTKGLAKALAPHVTVNAVAPGTVLLAEEYDDTEEQRLIDRTPLKRVGAPEDIAAAVAFLIEGSDFINGATINVDGGRSLA